MPTLSTARPQFGPATTTAIISLTLLSLLAASSTPTPLYPYYQAAWGFGATLVTVIFAIYALALLLALLVLGRLSDHLGRRPVILAALLLELVAMVGFYYAQGPGWLVAMRVIQGFATGMATTALGAALLDNSPLRGPLINSFVPMTGMGVGAIGTSVLLAILGTPPLQAAYAVWIVVFSAAVIALWWLPETRPPQPGAWASLRPQLALPAQARTALLRTAPAVIAVWMLGGFYLSLMPSLLAATTGSPSPWLTGLSVAALTFTGSLAILFAQPLSPTRALRLGTLTLCVGMALILIALSLNHATLLLIGSVVGGVGFGMAFLGAVRTVFPLAPPESRAGLMATFYTVCYLANSLPAILMGYLAQRAGLVPAAYAYGGSILVLGLLALVLAWRQPQVHASG